MSLDVMKQALEALQAYGSHASNCDYLVLLTSLPPQRKPCSCGLANAITALRAAIEQAQKPVAWISESENLLSWDKFYDHMTPLYTAPRQWQGLTDEAIANMCDSVPDFDIGTHDLIRFARAIEAKLKEKNNG